jgi:hypothetical protein
MAHKHKKQTSTSLGEFLSSFLLYFIRTWFFVLNFLHFAFCPHCTRHTSMPPWGFEPATPESDRPQTLAFDRLGTGIGFEFYSFHQFKLGRYSDSLRGGRSEDRIPVEARFSALIKTGAGDLPISCTMGTG